MKLPKETRHLCQEAGEGLTDRGQGGTPLQLGLEVDRSVQIVGPANTRPNTPAARPTKLYAEDGRLESSAQESWEQSPAQDQETQVASST